MKPVAFDGMSSVMGVGQPEYDPLPAYRGEKETLSCWRLTWRERLTVLFRGNVWVWQMDFGRPTNPLSLQVESPFAPTADTGGRDAR